jgi:hypothetical protein
VVVKHYRVSYPISKQVKAALKDFPNIAASARIPSERHSDLEIVRLLDNQQYPWIRDLTFLIEETLPFSGEIGKKVLHCKDQLQFSQAISEMYLLRHVYGFVGPDVFATSFRRDQGGWDITAKVDDHELRIEVYTPEELAGHQLFDRLLSTILKYLDIPIGYYLDVKIGIQKTGSGYNQRDLYYVYDTGNKDHVNEWLFEFEKRVKSWIKCESIKNRTNGQLTIPGPGNGLRVVIHITRWAKDSRERCIRINWPTRSSDTELFFRNTKPENIAKNEWGKKVRKKLFSTQCGEQSKGYTRVLVLNFILADTGWPEFISGSWFSTSFGNYISFITRGKKPFDVVIPAQLGFDCCFGKPAWISDYHKENHDYLAQLGMNRPCKPPPKASQKEIEANLII